MNINTIRIDNCVITKYDNGIKFTSIKLAEKYDDVNISHLPIISLGSKAVDNQLIRKLIDGLVEFYEVINFYMYQIQ